MDRSHLDIIGDLMDELQDQMQYSSSDFEDRLGRNKDSELTAMPMKDEGEMKETGPHLGVNRNPGMKPEDEDISPRQMMEGDLGEDDGVDEEERLRGRVMRLRA